MLLRIIICIVLGYAFGCISTGYLIGKANHVDIRRYGSGNAGTTNALRTLGWKAGALTLIGDILKAVIPILASFGRRQVSGKERSMAKDMINNGINAEDKSRMIQEYVPGKQITLAHMVTRPKASVYRKLGLPDDYHDAIGIMTITPSEATIIAADICTKAASIKLGFVDRFSGSVIIVGSTANVESALNSVITTFYNKLGFDTVAITKT